jgi:peptidoglycan hydrolase CwlO-like protein
MGRYYTGDIEGKFWFAVQSSDAASRFAPSAEIEVGYIPYYFNEEDHLEEIQAELKNIEDKLGDNLKKIDDFFEKVDGYNDDILKANDISKEHLSDYADYKLGKKIEECVIRTGECSFDAEL